MPPTTKRQQALRAQILNGLVAAGLMVVAALVKKYWGVDVTDQ
jgi:hypothetical protein